MGKVKAKIKHGNHKNQPSLWQIQDQERTDQEKQTESILVAICA